MEQFVKAIEIWVPSITHSMTLELSSSYYGELDDFKASSETMTFAYDEGLPGKTWSHGRPIVLTDLENSYFQRAEAANKAGIVCGISIPVYSGDFLQSVVVIFCGGDANTPGALEFWHNLDGSDFELKLDDGFYGELEKFEWTSRRLTIMRGRGLPGIAWEQDKPIIIDDLANSSSFLRGNQAAKQGITTGLAIPLSYQGDKVQILTLLSAQQTPIAKRFEIWLPDSDTTYLHFDSGMCTSGADLAAEYADVRIVRGERPLGESWLTGRPLIADTASGEKMVVLPVIKQGAFNSIVCLVL